MLNSVRARLTLWYTGVLALVLIAFAVAAYMYVERLTMRRTDNSLVESADAFATNFAIEQGGGETAEEAAREAVTELRFRDRRFHVFNRDNELVAASKDTSTRLPSSD